MLKAEDFLMEDTHEEIERKNLKKGMEGVKEMALYFLGKANGLYKRAAKGDPNPMLAGKAIAYLTCFQELAPVIGLKKEMYFPIVKTLWEKLGDLTTKVDLSVKKTLIVHQRDPEGIKLEAQKLELDKKKVELREVKPELTIVDERQEASAVQAEADESMIANVTLWLERALSYDRRDAERRARLVYKPGLTLEELVAAGCRVGK